MGRIWLHRTKIVKDTTEKSMLNRESLSNKIFPLKDAPNIFRFGYKFFFLKIKRIAKKRVLLLNKT